MNRSAANPVIKRLLSDNVATIDNRDQIIPVEFVFLLVVIVSIEVEDLYIITVEILPESSKPIILKHCVFLEVSLASVSELDSEIDDVLEDLFIISIFRMKLDFLTQASKSLEFSDNLRGIDKQVSSGIESNIFRSDSN